MADEYTPVEAPVRRKPEEDPEVIALRRETESITAMVEAMRRQDLESRLAQAEKGRQALDSVLRLTSGKGLRNPLTGVRQPRDDETLLGRLEGTTTYNPGTLKSRNGLSSTITTVPGASAVIAQPVTAIGRIGSPGVRPDRSTAV